MKYKYLLTDNPILIFILCILLLFILRVSSFYILLPDWSEKNHVSFTSVLLSDPQNSNVNSYFIARCCGFVSNREVVVITNKYSKLHYGETLSIDGEIKESISKGRKSFLLYYPNIKVIKEQSNIFTQMAYYLRQRIYSTYLSILPFNDASLLMGIVFGIKGEYSRDFMDNLTSTGVLHVIAASGMNVTLLASFISCIFGKFMGRKLTIVMNGFMLLFYSLIAGFQTSIIRACIMSFFSFGAGFIGRQYTAMYSLFITAGLMLFIQPDLVSSISFQLSFLSTLGILLFQNHLDKYIHFGDISTTISSQIMTIPILISTFGSYGMLSILANALVLWIIPLLMCIGIMGGLLSLILYPLGVMIVFLSVPFLSYFTYIINLIGSWHVNLLITHVPLILLIGYYLLLCSLKLFLRRPGNEKI